MLRLKLLLVSFYLQYIISPSSIILTKMKYTPKRTIANNQVYNR